MDATAARIRVARRRRTRPVNASSARPSRRAPWRETTTRLVGSRESRVLAIGDLVGANQASSTAELMALASAYSVSNARDDVQRPRHAARRDDDVVVRRSPAPLREALPAVALHNLHDDHPRGPADARCDRAARIGPRRSGSTGSCVAVQGRPITGLAVVQQILQLRPQFAAGTRQERIDSIQQHDAFAE